jgi:hypothetical protein
MGPAPPSLVLRVIMGLRLKIGPDLLDRVPLAEGHIHGSLGQRPRNWGREKSFRRIYELFRQSYELFRRIYAEVRYLRLKPGALCDRRSAAGTI